MWVPWPLPMMHWTSQYRDPASPSPSNTGPCCTGHPQQSLSDMGPHCTGTLTQHQPPWTCSNLFIINHVRFASGWLASYWDAFLFYVILLRLWETTSNTEGKLHVKTSSAYSSTLLSTNPAFTKLSNWFNYSISQGTRLQKERSWVQFLVKFSVAVNTFGQMWQI